MFIRIYVGNLDHRISDIALDQLFRQVGSVKCAQISISKLGKTRGFGVVEMSSSRDVTAAITQFNGKVIDGRRLIMTDHRN